MICSSHWIHNITCTKRLTLPSMKMKRKETWNPGRRHHTLGNGTNAHMWDYPTLFNFIQCLTRASRVLWDVNLTRAGHEGRMIGYRLLLVLRGRERSLFLYVWRWFKALWHATKHTVGVMRQNRITWYDGEQDGG